MITQKTEDEAVIALHDNGLDIALTIEALLEGPQVKLCSMCICVFSRSMFDLLFLFSIGIMVNDRKEKEKSS